MNVVKGKFLDIADEHLSQANEERGQPITVPQLKDMGTIRKSLTDCLHILEAVKLRKQVKGAVLVAVQLEALDQFTIRNYVQEKYYDVLDLFICINDL